MGFTCEICGVVAKSKAGLAVHKGMVHKGGESKENTEKKVSKKKAPKKSLKKETPKKETSEKVPKKGTPEEVPGEANKVVPLNPIYVPSPPSLSVAPPPPPPALPVEVPVGSRVILLSTDLEEVPLWVWNPDTSQHELASIPEPLEVTVVDKSRDHKGLVYLTCKVPNGKVYWYCLERDVLNGKIKYAYLMERVPSEIPTPTLQATTAEKESFLDSLRRYVEIRDRKNKVTSEFTKVDKKDKPVVIDYVSKYGEESEAGLSDSLLCEDGYRIHYKTYPGREVIERDEETILNYIKESGFLHCLKYTVDWKMWESLKQSGVVDSEFIQQVETIKEVEPARKLFVDPLEKK